MPEPVRLGLLVAAPLYYFSSLYQRLAADPRLDLTVFYISSAGIGPHDAGYAQPISWDSDLLSGYRSIFLARAAKNPLYGSFWALRDIDIVSKILSVRPEILWVHGYNALTYVLAALTQKTLRRPVLFGEEQTLLHSRPVAKRLVKLLALRVLLLRSYGLYIGTQNRRWFEHYGVRRDRLFFTPYAVDNTYLQEQARKLRPHRSSTQEAFGIKTTGSPVVLMVCRLIPEKQPLLALEIFKRVRANRQCTFLIVGSGELEPAMRQKIQAEQIPDVVFTGFLNRSAIPHAYSAADIFLLPSRDETWGLAVNEAMNFSLPVVVSDKVGCAADLVQDGQNGFVVAASNVAQFAHRLTELVEHESLRKQFGNESLSIIEGWSIEKAAEGVTEAVAHAVGARRWRATCETL